MHFGSSFLINLENKENKCKCLYEHLVSNQLRQEIQNENIIFKNKVVQYQAKNLVKKINSSF